MLAQNKYFSPEKKREKDGQTYTISNSNLERPGIAILISDKVHFISKKTTRKRGLLHNDKRVNLPRRSNNSKYVIIKSSASTYMKQPVTELKE